MLASVFMTRL